MYSGLALTLECSLIKFTVNLGNIAKAPVLCSNRMSNRCGKSMHQPLVASERFDDGVCVLEVLLLTTKPAINTGGVLIS